ncbi:MAG: hypothetical protein ACRC92_08010 [Peptostreptococcaceae bacterium]
MEIKIGTHRGFNQTETMTLCGVLTEYACSDRCDYAEVMHLKEELFKTKMYEKNDHNKCILVRAIKYELSLLGTEDRGARVRRYKETLERLRKRIEG